MRCARDQKAPSAGMQSWVPRQAGLAARARGWVGGACGSPRQGGLAAAVDKVGCWRLGARPRWVGGGCRQGGLAAAGGGARGW
eukprot:3047839-Prymnesium_polylepis.1